jgi:molecular chaperone DnaK
MTRTTIDFGIDLGTTNSAIAVLRGVEAEVIKNNDNADTTPSAVWIDKRDRLYVGQAARDRSEIDPDNTRVEFKLRMGTSGDAHVFPASGRTMGPEQLSAEVLKSLTDDVLQRTGEQISAAAITVPAAFDMSACDATRRAAELAGITHAPLLQEPTAAALAYGFQAAEERTLWLVYDLGGGTFDAAVVQLRDGEFSVVNHRGDNFLGGKLIDWKVVEDLFIPAITREYGLTDLRRGNARWRGVINKLKLAAEAAKIRLSRYESADVLVEFADESGRDIEFEYELHRSDVAHIAEPLMVRSINLCRKALEERRLGSGDIAKAILVGGPTLSPYLRERLSDPDEGLGIALDFTQDPLTAVARGAAIFAGTQRLATVAPTPRAGTFTLNLEYQPVGPDEEPIVAGRLVNNDVANADVVTPADFTGYTVELTNADSKPPWRSGRIGVAPEGLFVTSLWAERGKRNAFGIALYDATGTRREVAPDQLSYTVGVVETRPPLTQSVGIGLEGNQVEWLLEKGTSLPARRRVLLRTAVSIRRGQPGGMLRIPVLEGEHGRADRNRRIGRLEVESAKVTRDVPEGSEVEVTLEIDTSRLVIARAYVPILDEEFEHAINLQTETVPGADELGAAARAEFSRLSGVKERQYEINSSVVELMLLRIDDERIVAEIESLVDAARIDPEAATTCGKRLLDLRAALDEIEDELEWPELERTADSMVVAVPEIVEANGDSYDKQALSGYIDQVFAAKDRRDPELLRQRLDELAGLARSALDRNGGLQVLYFESLKGHRAEMGSKERATRLISEGQQAAGRGDFARLREINRQLAQMLPEPPPPPDPFSTVRRS